MLVASSGCSVAAARCWTRTSALPSAGGTEAARRATCTRGPRSPTGTKALDDQVLKYARALLKCNATTVTELIAVDGYEVKHYRRNTNDERWAVMWVCPAAEELRALRLSGRSS